MSEINLALNFLNYRRKVSKFKRDKEVMKIGKKDLEEQLIKYKDTIDVL